MFNIATISHSNLSYQVGKSIDNMVELKTMNSQADFKKVLIYYQA